MLIKRRRILIAITIHLTIQSSFFIGHFIPHSFHRSIHSAFFDLRPLNFSFFPILIYVPHILTKT